MSKCKSPALRESAFCYHHVNLRRATAPKGVFDSIMLPPLEDSCGLQIALHEVLDAIVHQRIDSKRAGLLLYGLQIAAQLNARRTEVPNPVRDVCHDSDGNTLAPEETACDPAEDSLEQCDDREKEKEEEEEQDHGAEDESEEVHSGSPGSNVDKNEHEAGWGEPLEPDSQPRTTASLCNSSV